MSSDLELLWFAEDERALPPAEGLAHAVTTLVRSSADALDVLERTSPAVAVVDIGGAAGRELLATLARRYPEIGLVALATDEESVRDAVRRTAAELVPRGADVDALARAVGRAAERARGFADEPPPSALDTSGAEREFVGTSKQIQELTSTLDRVSGSEATVLLRGETGTGKELAARAIHRRSQRAKGPFVAVHAAALPEELLESELFGYEKGAFTGAVSRKPGRVELAEGGTLFLDEIAEVSAKIQAKLLRLLQEREFESLGGTRPRRADVRFIAATHRDLEDMMGNGQFREDLFYRLNVLTVWLPPLRARRSDVDELVRHFLATLGPANGKPALKVDDGALRLLRAQRWPGNVRQLMNFVERLVVLSSADVITETDVKTSLEERGYFPTESTIGASLAESIQKAGSVPPPSSLRPLREEVHRAEREALVKALARAGGNRTLAARLLGVGRRTLYSKLEEHGLL